MRPSSSTFAAFVLRESVSTPLALDSRRFNAWMQLCRQNVAHAPRRTTVAWILSKCFQVVSVVKGDLLSGRKGTAGENPYPELDQLRVTIRIATMIEQARRIRIHIAVQVRSWPDAKD